MVKDILVNEKINMKRETQVWRAFGEKRERRWKENVWKK